MPETTAQSGQIITESGINMPALLSTVTEWLLNVALPAIIRIILALIILGISFRIINGLARKIEKKSEKKGLDKTVTHTLLYIGKLFLKIVIAIALVGFVGIDTSGLAALVASLGVCIGLAVNGAVGNIAGGVLILVTRPFKIDDFIEAQGVSGVVEDIHMVNTRIRTNDNKVVYIPNGALSSGTVINYSVKDLRRVDLSFSIGYGDDFEKAKELVMQVITSHELVLTDPAPMVRVSEHGASSINLVARAWVKNSDYWTVHFDLLEMVKKTFDANGIEIPFNQLDVHVKND